MASCFPLTKEERLIRQGEIAVAVKGGASVERVAEDYGLSAQTVRNYCWKVGVSTRRRPIGAPSKSVEKLLQRVVAGESVTALAKERGCTVSAIRSNCRRYGVQLTESNRIVGERKCVICGETYTKTVDATRRTCGKTACNQQAYNKRLFDRNREILRLYNIGQGVNFALLAAHFSLSPSGVSFVIKSYGLPSPSQVCKKSSCIVCGNDIEAVPGSLTYREFCSLDCCVKSRGRQHSLRKERVG